MYCGLRRPEAGFGGLRPVPLGEVSILLPVILLALETGAFRIEFSPRFPQFQRRTKMKRAILGLLMGTGVVILAVCLLGRRSEVMAQHAVPYSQSTPQPSPQPVCGGDLIAVPSPMGDKGQMLTVLDPRQQTMGVYWIEAATGKITLRSVRNIRYDLMMTDFNGDNPLPREIRLQLEQR
jgi:hypothetical protein